MIEMRKPWTSTSTCRATAFVETPAVLEEELERWSLRSSQGARAIEKAYDELNGELP